MQQFFFISHRFPPQKDISYISQNVSPQSVCCIHLLALCAVRWKQSSSPTSERVVFQSRTTGVLSLYSNCSLSRGSTALWSIQSPVSEQIGISASPIMDSFSLCCLKTVSGGGESSLCSQVQDWHQDLSAFWITEHLAAIRRSCGRSENIQPIFVLWSKSSKSTPANM